MKQRTEKMERKIKLLMPVDIKQYLPYCLGRKALIEIKTNNI